MQINSYTDNWGISHVVVSGTYMADDAQSPEIITMVRNILHIETNAREKVRSGYPEAVDINVISPHSVGYTENVDESNKNFVTKSYEKLGQRKDS